MRAAFLHLLILMAFSSTAHGLECVDVQELANQITDLRDSDAQLGVRRGLQSLASLIEGEDACVEGEARLLAAIGSNLHILGRNREAADRFAEGLARLDGQADDQLLALLHRGAGVALADAEDYDQALQQYLAALQASDRAGDLLESAKTAGNIGNLHNALNDLAAARAYHQRALETFRKAGWKPGIAGSLVNLGAVASKQASDAHERGEQAAAREHNIELLHLNEQALVLFDELENARGIAYAQSNIGLAHDRLGDPGQAVDYHQNSLAVRREIGDVHGMINSLLYLSATYIELGRLEQAQATVEEAQAVLPEGHQGFVLEILGRRSELAEARGDSVGALAYLREYLQLYRQIMEEGRRRQVVELRERYDAGQQASQIEALRSAEQLSQLQLQRQRLQVYAGMAVAFLLLVVLGVLAGYMRLGRRAAHELRKAARTDPLTGLPNRREIVEHIEQAITQADRNGVPFCLVMADIDRFKSINDAHGHDAGDEVLVQVARRLQQGIRARDTLARWGGEEFLLLLPETDADAGMLLADRLRKEIAQAPFRLTRGCVGLTLSFGINQYRPGTGMDRCLHAADQAMYLGKHDGGDRVRIA